MSRPRSGLSGRSASRPGGHFIPDATRNVPFDINGTNDPAVLVALLIIDVQTEEICCIHRARLEHVARRMLLQFVFVGDRRIPNGAISATGIRLWTISAPNESPQRGLAIGIGRNPRDLITAETVSQDVAPLVGD